MHNKYTTALIPLNLTMANKSPPEIENLLQENNRLTKELQHEKIVFAKSTEDLRGKLCRERKAFDTFVKSTDKEREELFKELIRERETFSKLGGTFEKLLNQKSISASSAREFHQQISLLQTLVSKLQLHSHQQTPGVSDVSGSSTQVFPRFGSLPLELRRIPNRSRAKPIMNTCKEARNVVCKLQLGYIYADRHLSGVSGCMIPQSLQHWIFSTYEHDTFWFTGKGFSLILNNYGTCFAYCNMTAGNRGSEFHEGRYHPVPTGRQPQPRLRRMALNLDDFFVPASTKKRGINRFLGNSWTPVWDSAAILWQHGVEELLLVVESFGNFNYERDVLFVPPDEQGRANILHGWRRRNGGDSRAGFATNWDFSAKILYHELKILRSRQLKERRLFLESDKYTKEQKKRALGMTDLSNWVVPKVGFVVAKKKNDPLSQI
ncbi:hypothetical protein HYFRA_00003229 [Hymenoscyphus fraxineus]|uniref:Uncharacterized protein n=1 Tax=Hymenoscyphus fraxineus TaxID=746836 RepID=A0A9N9KT07_9HELO|nr:hypothetical protein HYFRA_00003229 [Hymenoscyphus fraxineus]